MSERYSRLFALSENLYASGSPVIIAAGALLKDNQTGKVIAQLKFRNISSKAIKAATVCISPFDIVGKPIGEAIQYQYLDLNAQRDETFGSKVPIALPNDTTRSFSATVTEIAFVDNTLWTASAEPWEALPVPSPISQSHGAQFEKQFHLKYGTDCKNLPLFEKDLWYCPCGALNRQEDTLCHSCRKSFAVISSYNEDELNKEMEQRLAEEKAKAEYEAEQARIKREAEAEQARIKKEQAQIKAKEAAKKAIKPALLAAGILAVMLFVVKVIMPAVKYSQADKLVAAGQYDEAIEAYLAMEESEKRENRISAAHYAHAESLLAAEEYEQAVAQFKKIGDYEDAKDRVNATYYAYAESLFAKKEFEQAVKQFQKAGNYEDAKDRILATHYAYAEDLLAQKEFVQAANQFKNAGNYEDAQEQEKSALYAHAEDLLSRELFLKAIAQFEELGDYKDAAERVLLAKYARAESLVSGKQRYIAYQAFKELGSYSDATERAAQLIKELQKSLSIELVYFNTDKKDSKTTATSISKKSSYLHYGYKVNGLYPNETIELVQTYTWPGEKEKLTNWTWEDVTSGKVVENNWNDGYTSPDYGEFKIEIHIFDNQKNISDADTPIGKFSMKIPEPPKQAKKQSWGIGGATTGVSSVYGGRVSIW